MRGWWITCALIGCRWGFDDAPPSVVPPDGGGNGDPPLLDVCGDSSALAPDAPWPVMYGCSTNAGRSAFRGPDSRATGLGPVPIEAGWTGIVIGSGNQAMFSVYNPGNTSAFDIVSGKKVWGTPTPGSMPWLAIGTTNDVYVPSDHGIYYCLDAIDGTERYRKQIGGSLQAPLLALGNVYFGSETYGVWAVETAEPYAVKWHYDVPGGGRVAALAFAAGKIYFVDTLASRLYALDAVSGENAFDVAITGTAVGSPVIGVDAVYVATMTRGIAAFDLESGGVRWQQPPAIEPVVQPALLSNGDLITSGASGFGFVVDWTTGMRRRTFSVGGGINAPPIVAGDDTSYFATTNGIVAIDPADGDVAWQSSLNGKMALGDRTMVVVPVEGQFAVIGP